MSLKASRAEPEPKWFKPVLWGDNVVSYNTRYRHLTVTFRHVEGDKIMRKEATFVFLFPSIRETGP